MEEDQQGADLGEVLRLVYEKDKWSWGLQSSLLLYSFFVLPIL